MFLMTSKKIRCKAPNVGKHLLRQLRYKQIQQIKRLLDKQK